MNDLSETLNSSGIGGYLGEAFFFVMLMIYVLLTCPPVECHISYNIFICDVDIIYTIILLIVFIQCVLSFLN